MDQNPQGQVPPTRPEPASDDLRARAIEELERFADRFMIAGPEADRRGTKIFGDTDIRQLDDDSLSFVAANGATIAVDAKTVAEKRAEWTTEEMIADRISALQKVEADRRRVRLGRKLGRDTAHVTEFYRDDAGAKRTRLKAITLAPRRPAAGRGIGRAARQATNHRSAGSRRTAASSSTAGTDPGDPDPDPELPAAPLRLAPSPRAVLTFGVLTAERRGAVIV
ncbi:MAG: hypothetical protein ACLGI5_20760 [Thermoleophilia bacterium]